MKTLNAGPRSSHRPSAPPLGVLFPLLVVISAICAALIVTSPIVGIGLALFLGFIVFLEASLPVSAQAAFPLLVLLLVPFDQIVPFAEDRRGFPILALASVLFVSALLRNRIRVLRGSEWWLVVLVVAYLASYALHASGGELRGSMYWVAAALVFLWLASLGRRDVGGVRAGIEWAIVLAGALTGGVGVLERAGLIDVTDWFQLYEPAADVFSEVLGVRATGLSGHALRLGSVTMLSCGVIAARFISGTLSKRTRIIWLISLACSGTGLIASGARGSWLALGISVLAGSVILRSSPTVRGQLGARLGVLAAVTVGALAVSGLGVLIRERLVGSAMTPMSWHQRTTALQSVGDAIGHLPLIGVGHGGIAAFLLQWGLILPQLENEYLIALIAGGPMFLVVWIVWTIGILRRGIDLTKERGDATYVSLPLMLLLNLGTYNFLSWSSGAPILAVVSYLVLADADSKLGFPGMASDASPVS
jgi:hypothetical protein